MTKSRSKAKPKRATRGGPKAVSDDTRDEIMWGSADTGASIAGVRVTAESALRVSTVLACVRVLSETLASLPCILYRRLPEGGKVRAYDNPRWTILHDQPNEWQTAFEFFEMMMGHLCLRGNAVARILPGPAGAVSSLIPLHPDRVTVNRLPTGRLLYTVRLPDGTSEKLTQDQVFHVRGLSSDGMWGLDPITYSQTAVGLSMAVEQHASGWFGNSAKPELILKFPNKLTADAAEEHRRQWNARHRGPGRTGGTGVLMGGMDIKEVGVNNEQSQMLETRKLQANEIARIFRVPPHLIGDLEKATFSNIEQQSLEFVVYTMRPWLVRWEQAIQRDLIYDENYFAEFLIDGLLRGDAKSRAEALQVRFRNGNINGDEWRAIENQNPIPGGDQYYVTADLIPIGTSPFKVANTAPPAPEPADPDGSDDAGAMRRLQLSVIVSDAVDRCLSREAKMLRPRMDKAGNDWRRFNTWIEGAYGDHLSYVQRAFQVVVRVAGDRDDGLLSLACASLAAKHRDLLTEMIDVTHMGSEQNQKVHRHNASQLLAVWQTETYATDIVAELLEVLCPSPCA